MTSVHSVLSWMIARVYTLTESQIWKKIRAVDATESLATPLIVGHEHIVVVRHEHIWTDQFGKHLSTS